MLIIQTSQKLVNYETLILKLKVPIVDIEIKLLGYPVDIEIKLSGYPVDIEIKLSGYREYPREKFPAQTIEIY